MPRVTRDFADDDLVELRRAARELSFLAELARVTASAIDSNDLFQLIIGETCRVLGVEVCSLYVVQEGDLVLAATNGLNPAGVGAARMPIGVGITGEAARSQTVIPLRDARADPRFHWIDGIDQERFTAMCSVPVVSGDARVVGVLNVQREEAHEWTADEQATLTAIASQLAGIIERTELQRRLQEQLAVQRDATERWRRLTESRSDLLSIVSHDVRTPLAIALTYVEALYERLNGEERTVIDQVRTELGHVGRMVETVLTGLAVEAGVIPLARGDVDLVAFVRESADAARRIAGSRHITVGDTPEPIVVYVDADKLRQVIHNLLLNAVRHTPDAGAVTVTVQREADYAVITVDDQGLGVPPELREEVFERFRRGARRSGGTGLGLFIVRTIVEAHGGSVGVGDAPGGGARFWVRLPIGDEARS